MSIRTTVTLDDDVLERVKCESRARGVSFREMLNEALRIGLLSKERPARRMLTIKRFQMGYKPGLNYDDIESLIEYAEGEQHR